MPIFGKIHVAYISKRQSNWVIKINRIVHYFAQRPQVQERLTMQIAFELQDILGTEDIAVIVDAKHLCVSSRGIKDDTSATVTNYFGGVFQKKEKVNELLQLIKINFLSLLFNFSNIKKFNPDFSGFFVSNMSNNNWLKNYN